MAVATTAFIVAFVAAFAAGKIPNSHQSSNYDSYNTCPHGNHLIVDHKWPMHSQACSVPNGYYGK